MSISATVLQHTVENTKGRAQIATSVAYLNVLRVKIHITQIFLTTGHFLM